MKASAIKAPLSLCAAALAAALLLSSCATTSSTNSATVTTSQAFAPLSGTLTQYQELARTASGDSVYPANLLLARALIVSGQYNEAITLLQQLKAQAITPLQVDEASIVQALALTQQQQLPQANAMLQKVNVQTLPLQAQSYYYQLSSMVEYKLYQSTQDMSYLRSAFEHKRALIGSLQGNDRITVLKQAVALLQELSPSELSAALTRTTDEELRGYYEYALIDSSKNAALRDKLVQGWQEKYAGHVLNELIAPQATTQTTNQDNANPAPAAQYTALKAGDKIAVLLPLSGRYAMSVGEPARLGIIAALQDRNLKLQAVFYDTNRLTMSEIAARIKSDGTDYILGPVLKPEVQALLNERLDIPTIMLNNPQQALARNQWYFNLGPDYEGQLAAAKIALDGHRAPLIIHTSNEKARRALQGFNGAWTAAGGKAPLTCTLPNENPVSALSSCPLNAADSVYLATTAQQAPAIKNALPASMQVYITDQSFNGVNSSPNEALLVGAHLGDMPWLITDSTMKADFMQQIPKADAQVQRIFAAAYDSIGFALNVNNLAANPADVLHGLSGDLQLGPQGLIQSAPLWLTISFPRAQ